MVEYDGRPAVTYFFSSSGGQTESVQNVWSGVAPEAWLVGRSDPYDDSYNNPYYRWKLNLKLGSADAKLGKLIRGSLKGIKIVRHGVSPRIVQAKILGTKGATTATGAQLQADFGTPSTWMSFTTVTAKGVETSGSPPSGPTPTTTVTTPVDGGGGLGPSVRGHSARAPRYAISGTVYPVVARATVTVQYDTGSDWRLAASGIRVRDRPLFDPGVGTRYLQGHLPRDLRTEDRGRLGRPGMGAPLLLVDAPFLLYRSFFALPESIRGVDGHPVNAMLGSTNALLRIAADTAPRATVVCFGAEQAAYRVELYAGYHAQRPPMPETLAWQFEQAPALFDALGWRIENSDELEADDLLGAHALLEEEAGGDTLILTGDRDMYQCVTQRTRVLYLKQGSSGFETIDAAEVERRYGIPPALVPDFIALRGDPSDGLPGAPGIGEKTAAALLRRHGSLKSLLAAVLEGDAGERPRVAAALRDHADLLRAYREIAELRPVEVSRPPDTATDLAAGAAAATVLGMGNLAGRLEGATSLADL